MTTIGIPKEIKVMESRVACTPANAEAFIKQGNKVVVQANAGKASGFSDEEYEQAGAVVVQTAQEVFEQASLIIKVKEPMPEEFELFCERHTLFTYLHLAANPAVAEMLKEKRVTAIAYECVETDKGLPLLQPMSVVAGRMSALVGAFYLSSVRGGGGVLIGGVPGVLPGKVLVLGGGVAGINAARMASGMGADVTVAEIDAEKMRYIDETFDSRIRTLYSSEQNLAQILPQVDLVIGAVLVPGARAPKLLTRDMLKRMKQGSVFVDIAIDQGGCAETSKVTTHADPVYTEEGVLHYCVGNMPGAYARTSTLALTNVTMPYALALAKHGVERSMEMRPALATGLNTRNGEIVHPVVAEALAKS